MKSLITFLQYIVAVLMVTTHNLAVQLGLHPLCPRLAAVGDDTDKQLLEALGKVNASIAKVGDVEKAQGAQKTLLDGFTTQLAELQAKFLELQKQNLTALTAAPTVRIPGKVSDGCAKWLAAQFILHCEKSHMLEALSSMPTQRDGLVTVAKSVLGITGKAAVTTSDIALPVSYGSELRELISEFGVARRRMRPYPIGMGTAKPPRMGVRPAFGSIAMSAALAEKNPTIEFASLESHKIGGIVRLPREIDEQSIVPMGQFLARYGAVEFARSEDTWAFLADGTATYESVKGIVKIARDNTKTVVLAAGKTKPSDTTLADLRALRTKVNKAALSGNLSAYYLDTTWDTFLPSLRTAAEPLVYQRLPDGTAILDGYPIVWTDVLTPYGTAAAADQPLAVFGALDFWWFGEHGSSRIDTSEHVFFANDQLAVRFIEEIDFDYQAVDATAALITAAS